MGMREGMLENRDQKVTVLKNVVEGSRRERQFASWEGMDNRITWEGEGTEWGHWKRQRQLNMVLETGT